MRIFFFLRKIHLWSISAHNWYVLLSISHWHLWRQATFTVLKDAHIYISDSPGSRLTFPIACWQYSHWYCGRLPITKLSCIEPRYLSTCLPAYRTTSVLSDSLWSYGPWPTRLLCPWDSPGKNTEWVAMPPPPPLLDDELGIISVAGMSPPWTQGSNPCLLCLLNPQAGSLPLVPPGKLCLLCTYKCAHVQSKLISLLHS